MEPFQLVAFTIIVFVGVRSSVASPTRTRLAYAGGASCPLSARFLCGLGFDMRDMVAEAHSARLRTFTMPWQPRRFSRSS